jgi:D-alanine-D-alanine ligase-like ATP-grasp enzyme
LAQADTLRKQRDDQYTAYATARDALYSSIENLPEGDPAILAAKAVGLGIAGVDMLQSERGPLVLEVNSSPGLEGIEKTTKEDIAGKIIQYIERNVNR